MPFKHNAARRHRIPEARYRVRNWRAYEAGLTRRGDLALWLDEAASTGWHAPRRTTPGGQARYSDAAIEPVLTLRLVFHLALRQAEGVAGSVLRLLGRELRVRDRTTRSRRSRVFAKRRPEVTTGGARRHASVAAALNQIVRPPRARRPASWAAQSGDPVPLSRNVVPPLGIHLGWQAGCPLDGGADWPRSHLFSQGAPPPISATRLCNRLTPTLA